LPPVRCISYQKHQERERCRRNGKLARPEQRKAAKFSGTKIQWNWNNNEWAETYLPNVRVALVLLTYDSEELQRVIYSINNEGMMPELLNAFSSTKEHFLGMVKMLDTALDRSFIVLERFGYSPDNLPPETKLN
jgi:hypothetical protein